MDLFSRLPAEICMQTIIEVEPAATIGLLIRASPIMLRQYVLDRHIIARGIPKNIFSISTIGSLLQDALAVLHLSHKSTKPLRPEHPFLSSWISMGFQDPLKVSNKPFTVRLYQLIRRVILLIETSGEKNRTVGVGACTSLLETLHFILAIALPKSFCASSRGRSII
ncbi:hypothetical protein FBEOM_1843 [Fusarium beomiforme]|uniref:Uncharacterized protein n=1 Tax=Fusarium beomiforme TaxID=44412 RepID=A0A9P5E3K3_9HYPO|nr:hypothetical protein FBEOM_1843 [Fusarium beomiforme]